MHYFKTKTKIIIITLAIIILTLTLCLSTLAKTEVYFSLSDNPQKAIIKNINTVSQEELIKILKITEPLAQKIIASPFMSFPRTRESIILREELGGFKSPQDLTQLPEITTLEWEEWIQEGITITIN